MAASCGRQLLQRAAANLHSSSRLTPIRSISRLSSLQGQSRNLAPRFSSPAFTTARFQPPTASSFSWARRSYSSTPGQQQQEQQQQPPPPPPPPRSETTKVKFWPFFIIIALGFGGYALLVNQRLGNFCPLSYATLAFHTLSPCLAPLSLARTCFAVVPTSC